MILKPKRLLCLLTRLGFSLCACVLCVQPQPQRQYKAKHYFVCSCCQCIKGFQTLDDYNRHLELRHGPNRMRPPIPQKRPAKVDQATGIVLQRIGSVYPCPVIGCVKQFNKAIELKYHFDGVHKRQSPHSQVE